MTDRNDHPSRRRILASSAALGVMGLASRSYAGRVCGWALQTDAGPFRPPAASVPKSGDLVSLPKRKRSARGRVLHLTGWVQNDKCEPLRGALVTIWQTDDKGRYKHAKADGQDRLDADFGYYGAVETDKDGAYHFRTIIPRTYEFAGIVRAPHIHIAFTHRAYDEIVTELYFAGAEDDRIRKIDRVFKSRSARAREGQVLPLEKVAGKLAVRDPGAHQCHFLTRFQLRAAKAKAKAEATKPAKPAR